MIALHYFIQEVMGIDGNLNMELLGETIPGEKASLDQGKTEEGSGANKDIEHCQKEQIDIRHEQGRWMNAIDQFIEETQGQLDDSVEDDLNMDDYIQHYKHREAFEFTHFFAPKQVLDLKTDMNDNSEFIFKLKGKQYNLWKPDKLVITKALRDVFEKT